MTKQVSKKRFEVLPEETISDCLARMEAEGYVPSRRTEEPVFREVMKDGKSVPEVWGRKIVFEGKLQIQK
ncbi:NETI motif-containing protein [Ectobacillus sp. JY-23]|uniref:NETI motif-containing protein n=1 Tax=Ectobacillus sp. JY-23 TaxID=2933872 RepID=UPI001FF1273A|nr:NETI motif-containing protein [Ectobacillus sp. JY-23]UOY93054.1 NETI motif-containing protein [Ectobacillus sp. JY-23]